MIMVDRHEGDRNVPLVPRDPYLPDDGGDCMAADCRRVWPSFVTCAFAAGGDEIQKSLHGRKLLERM